MFNILAENITMPDPLYDLKNVANKKFFTDLPTRRIEYTSVLEVIYDEEVTDHKNQLTRYCQTLNKNFSEYPAVIEVPFSGNFTVECYDIREGFTLEAIQSEVLTVLDEKKVQVYVKYIISNLNQVLSKVLSLSLPKEFKTYQNVIADKLQLCIEHLKTTYLKLEHVNSATTPKIKWLGKTNVLATLIFDLWQGQEKDKHTKTQKMIEAQKQDLVALLLNNFVDSKNNPLKETTVDDYLNTSKPEKRAKKGIRIEL